jgi:hypothetical protein
MGLPRPSRYQRTRRMRSSDVGGLTSQANSALAPTTENAGVVGTVKKNTKEMNQYFQGKFNSELIALIVVGSSEA